MRMSDERALSIEKQGGCRDFVDATFSITSMERRAMAIEALQKLDELQTAATGTTEIDLTELIKIRCAIRLGLGMSIQ